MWTWVTTLVVLVSMTTLTHQQYSGSGQVDYNKIPDYLLECYSNQSLYMRDNRIPSTISSLISIIQKLEKGAAKNMDMRALTTTILRQYRLDGVERDPDITPAIGVIPFQPSGTQVYRMSVLFNQLLPAAGNAFPDDTLTPQEKCGLHFMLSDSIDVWDRQDTCGPVSTYNSRRPRSVDSDDAAEKGNSTSHDDVKPAGEENAPKISPGIMPVMAAAGTKSEVLANSSKEADAVSAEDAKKNENPEIEVHKAEEPLPLPDKATMRSGRLAMMPRNERMRSSYPVSDCPVENGVIYTRWGAVSAGILLSGIATGLQPQSVSVNKLLENSRRSGSRSGASSSSNSWSISMPNDKLSNLWLATLAGDLGEATIYQGAAGDIKIGVSGGWNDTTSPHWYFLTTKDHLDFTDAEIRGGLDGLIIGKKISTWYSQNDQRLRLSQVLDMYYSKRGIYDGSKAYRACQRKDYVTEVAPMEEMKQQALLAAKVILKAQVHNPMTDALLQQFSETAAQRLSTYIPSGLADAPCPPDSQTGTQTTPLVDIVIIVDTAWTFSDISNIIQVLAKEIDLGEYGDSSGAAGGGGSKITILSGKDATLPAIVNGSTSFLDIYANFTYDNYTKLPTGLDMVRMLTRLRSMYAWSMQNDRQNKITTGRPQVVLFMPSMSFTMGDSERSQAKSLVNRLNTKAPDTTLLFMGPSARDTFTDFVADKDKDIFQINASPDYENALDPLIKRLLQLPRRIINPACNYRWELDGSSGSSVQYADPMVGALFFKLQPNYFFTSDKTSLKFQGKGDGTMSVCYSRKQVLTGNNSTSSSSSSTIKCKGITSTETVEFTESQPCSGSSLIKSCAPMYFSVAATSTNKRCTDDTCRHPEMVRFSVTHSGLTCASGANGLKASGLSIALWIVLFSSIGVVNKIFFSE
ncbi:uncharacterized protein LOC124154540 [Ischnura elegans]|uniref:uncharacterized protein LOC124154540 n=1 Tax=Ischnura elegans TaxID=197161 RepID=UPI001ED881E3|nr:uncharacterized protein LOC124154540 [Ischnura elegans]